MSELCIECGARCCRYFCFEIDKPDSYEDFEDVRWYLCHEGVSVHVDEDGDWYIALENRCENLMPDNRCRIYEKRPLICRKYDPGSCDYVEGRYRYRQHFRSPDELDAYVRGTLGEAEHEARRAEAIARIEKSKQERKSRAGGQGQASKTA